MGLGDEAASQVWRRSASHVVARAHDSRLDSGLPQGRLEEAIEARGDDDPEVAAGDQFRNRAVSGGRALQALIGFLVRRLEVGLQQLHPLRRISGQLAQQLRIVRRSSELDWYA
ncbi:MAG: hypothetical protein M3406_05035 [Chloroflexota bacterium]|nr:hypothetical protein [Chloroflexota bacterium]